MAETSVDDLDAVAFTRGPGILGCLGTGATAAKAIAATSGKPLIGVHHMQAHALTPFLTQPIPPTYPFLTLLVSGGHTLVLLCHASNSFELLSSTMDNAIGVALDRTVKELAIPWSKESQSPGQALEHFLRHQQPIPDPPHIPFPSMERLSADRMSFGGLVAAMQRVASPSLPIEQKYSVARGVLEAAIKQVTRKVYGWITSLDETRNIKVTGVVASGGVASNIFLRTSLQAALPPSVSVHFPPVEFCTDNAAMIAWTAIDKLQRGKVSQWDSPVVHKWNIEECEREDSYDSLLSL